MRRLVHVCIIIFATTGVFDVSEAVATSIIQKAGPDDKGRMDYELFVIWEYLRSWTISNPMRSLKVFRVFDKGGCGRIGAHDVKKALASIGLPLSRFEDLWRLPTRGSYHHPLIRRFRRD